MKKNFVRQATQLGLRHRVPFGLKFLHGKNIFLIEKIIVHELLAIHILLLF